MIKFYKFRIIVENIIEYSLQGIIITFALFIIPSFRTLNQDLTFTRFLYICAIITSMLIIIDRILPDISKSIKSFAGIGISTLSNPNLL